VLISCVSMKLASGLKCHRSNLNKLGLETYEVNELKSVSIVNGFNAVVSIPIVSRCGLYAE